MFSCSTKILDFCNSYTPIAFVFPAFSSAQLNSGLAAAKWSCYCLRSDEPDRASSSLQHLGSQQRYGWLVSPAAWNDELVGPGRAPGRFDLPVRAGCSCHELRQTSAKSMDV